MTSSANDCTASNDWTPTSTEAGENAEDVHVIVVEDSSELLATQLDALDTCETQPPQRRQTLESGASF